MMTEKMCRQRGIPVSSIVVGGKAVTQSVWLPPESKQALEMSQPSLKSVWCDATLLDAVIGESASLAREKRSGLFAISAAAK
jgi:hypothetical protein